MTRCRDCRNPLRDRNCTVCARHEAAEAERARLLRLGRLIRALREALR